MKRRILLVDDEVAVLLTMKAVLEISGFEVETAASAREGKLRLRSHEYHMVITDMRMENDASGREVIRAARTASYRPAVALLTAFPVDEGDWQDLGADQLLLKPMHTRVLLEQIEMLFAARDKRLASLNGSGAAPVHPATKKTPVKVKKQATSAKTSQSATASKSAKASKQSLRSAATSASVKKQMLAAKKPAKATKTVKRTRGKSSAS